MNLLTDMPAKAAQDNYSIEDEFRRAGTDRTGSPLYRVRLLCGLLAMLMCAGCAGTQALTPAPLNSPYSSPQERWQRLNAEENIPKALKAIARIDLTTSSGRYPLKVAILFQYPERFRMESLPLFGPPDFYLTVENGDLRVFLPQEGKYYIGTTSPTQLAPFLPFFSSRFQLFDMLALLRGTLPLIRDHDVTLKGFQEREYYRLEVYRGEEKAQVLWLKPESNRLVRATRWGKNGELLYTAQFEGHGGLREAAGFPLKISVTTGPPSPATLILRYMDLQFPEDIPPDAFSLAIPPGVEPLRLNKE